VPWDGHVCVTPLELETEVLPLAACSDEICREGGCAALECLYRTLRWQWVERNDNPFPVSARWG
jgi:hypothetical protein